MINAGLRITRIKLNLKGFRALRTSPAVADDIRKRAERVADAAGPGWKAEPAKSKRPNRARYVVVATTPEARRESITEQTPLRALNAGRG